MHAAIGGSRRRYRNPPIDEAVCEFRFGSDPDWDLTIPGKLRTALAADYTGKPRTQKVIDVEIQSDEPAHVRYGHGLAKVLLFTDDGGRAVGVGADVLSIHMLRPYQDPERSGRGGWDEFRPRIVQALDEYWHVADPTGVCRISMRYINRIVVPGPISQIDNYLRCAVPAVSGLPESVHTYTSRVTYAYEDGTRLVLINGSISPPSDDVGFLLDIDVIWEAAETLTQPEALLRIDVLRDLERQVFETVITDKAREIFDAD